MKSSNYSIFKLVLIFAGVSCVHFGSDAAAENLAASTRRARNYYQDQCGQDIKIYNNYSLGRFYDRPEYGRQRQYPYVYGKNPAYPYTNYNYGNSITNRGYAPGYGSSIFYDNRSRTGQYDYPGYYGR